MLPFKIAPKDISQVLNIIVCNPRLRLYIPSCFVLMSNKTESSYAMALECLKQVALSLKLSLSPTLVMTDFEPALRNGIKNSFPNAQISGCYFHYTKCLWNKISKLCLRTKELKEKFNVLVSYLQILTHCKPEIREELFLYIKQIYQKPGVNKLYKMFLTYFQNNWAEKSFFG